MIKIKKIVNKYPIFDSRYFKTELGIFLLLAVVVFFAYRASLGLFFMQDDFYYLNFIQGSYDWTIAFKFNSVFVRPMIIWWVKLNYWISGLDPTGYHAIQLVMFILTVWLIYRLVLLIVGSRPGAIAGSLAYGLSSLHLQMIPWMSGSTENMMCLFSILSLYFFVKFKNIKQGDDVKQRWLYGVLTLLAFIFALLSKESPIFFPAVFFVYSYVTNPKIARSDWYLLGSILLFIIGYLLLRFLLVGVQSPSGLKITDPAIYMIWGLKSLWWTTDFPIPSTAHILIIMVGAVLCFLISVWFAVVKKSFAARIIAISISVLVAPVFVFVFFYPPGGGPMPYYATLTLVGWSILIAYIVNVILSVSKKNNWTRFSLLGKKINWTRFSLLGKKINWTRFSLLGKKINWIQFPLYGIFIVLLGFYIILGVKSDTAGIKNAASPGLIKSVLLQHYTILFAAISILLPILIIFTSSSRLMIAHGLLSNTA